ncbi:hypothetical protein [Actinomadura harenae]|uniref:Uncharacterized protein n=1 Tax=Actinomadura harenae TaxID=2483351 RepID=A0A3M2M7B2_9ACTN|nr:hypothetical protein [Actinomadura harenae]RMI44870.1 hypothetical protein EBO15_11335 [Actinomadura harenae]
MLTSAPDCFTEALSEGALPREVVEAVLEDGRAESLAYLALNQELLEDDPELLSRLAALGLSQVARAVVLNQHGHRSTEWWLLRGFRELLAAARPHEAWTGPDGALPRLEHSYLRWRRTLVVCPIGRWARSTLIEITSDLTRAEQLRGLLTVHDHDGGLEQLGNFDQDRFRPAVAEVLRTVLAGGDVTVLREAVAIAEGTDGLIEELYEQETIRNVPTFALDMLGLRVQVDWEALTRAHADRPFGANALATLRSRHDCPAELHPPLHPLKAAASDPDLPALVAKHLGDRVEAWRAARARLTRFKGELADLLPEIGEEAPAKGRAGKTAAWPGAGDLPAWDAVASVSGARAKFLALLDAASVETQLKLLRHLDDRTVAELFGQGTWHDDWLDFAMKARLKRYRFALAQRPSLTAEAIETLMGRDDPAINARLFLRTAATGTQRERLLSGRLTKELVERLLERTGGFRARDAVSCSNTELQRHILTLVRVRGLVPQQRLMLNLWERGGVAAVRDLLENEPKGRNFSRNVIRPDSRRFFTKLVNEPDADAALETLRATVATGETAEDQIAILRMRGIHPSAEIFREAHLWRWDELLAEHRREPLGTIILLGLAENPDCPQEFRDEADRNRWRWVDYENKVISGDTPEEILGVDVDAQSLLSGGLAGSTRSWLGKAVRAEAVTWEQVAALARPAALALAAVPVEDARATVGPLVREHLDPSRDTWVLALHMLPDFTGTITELFTTAAIATAATR